MNWISFSLFSSESGLIWNASKRLSKARVMTGVMSSWSYITFERPPFGVPPGLKVMGRRRRTSRILLKINFNRLSVPVFIELICKYLSVNYPFGDFDLTGLVSLNIAGIFFSFTDRRASSDIRCNSFEGVNFVTYKETILNVVVSLSV